MAKGNTELELERFRLRLWKARGRHSRIVGTIYLIMSALFLILAFITRYIVFEIISIISMFLGVIIVFSSIERYMKELVGNRAVASPLLALNELLQDLSFKGEAIFLPPNKDGSLKAFIPVDDTVPLPTQETLSEDRIIIPDKGLLIHSTGSGLLQLYEEELGDIRRMDFDYLLEWLPRTLVEGLKMCEKAEIKLNGEEVQIRMLVSVFRHLCQREETLLACKRLGCPLSSSIASTLAKNTNRAVHYKHCEYNPTKRETIILYEMGLLFKED